MKQSLQDHVLLPEKGKRGAAFLLRQAKAVYDLPDDLYDALERLREERNRLTHEQPTSRKETYDPAACEHRISPTKVAFDACAPAVFELFRIINKSAASMQRICARIADRMTKQGPFTRKEKERLDFLRERKTEFEKEIAELRQELADNPDREHRAFLEDEIAHYEKVVGMIRKVIPD